MNIILNINTMNNSKFLDNEFMKLLADCYGASDIKLNSGGDITLILPRDDSFLPASVSDEYYDAVHNVMEFAPCSKEEAIDALNKVNNNVVLAIKLFNPDFSIDSE